MSKITKIIIIVQIAVIAFLFFSRISSVESEIEFRKELGLIEEESKDIEYYGDNMQAVLDRCSNETYIENKVGCVVMFTKTILYNASNPTSNISDIFIHGGTCVSFKELFRKVFRKMGLVTPMPIDLYHNNRTRNGTLIGHTVAVVNDNETFCIVQHKSFHCYPW